MSNKILVISASRTGFTVGVAEAIGKTQTDSGLQVDVRAMQDVADLTPYQTVVAGSAIQNKQRLPEAMQFMHNYRLVLTEKSCAFFMVCMTLAMPNTPYRLQVAE